MSAIATTGLALALIGVVFLFERRLRPAAALLFIAAIGALAYARLVVHPVNPEALAAMDGLERRCAAQPARERTAACASAIDLHQKCSRDSCAAREYHSGLVALGFELPPLHRN